MPQCTFVTYRDLPQLDPDDRLVLKILEERGYDCAAAVWDGPDVNWSEAGVTILRSTWDYHMKFEQFLTWIERTSEVTELFNRPKYVRWSVHKSYLRDLEAQGVPIVPTQWLSKGASGNVEEQLRTFLKQTPDRKMVVKPAIGLATSGVMLVDESKFDQSLDHVSKLLLDVDVMVQPFMSSVQERGERSLIFINGRYCHAAQKAAFQALATAGGAGEKPVAATVDEVDLAELAMSSVTSIVAKHEPEFNDAGEELFLPPPLYARVDIVRDSSNKPRVIELELVEPSLFLAYAEDTAQIFADAIVNLINRKARLDKAKHTG